MSSHREVAPLHGHPRTVILVRASLPQGYSCAQFQSLPPEERNPETAAVLRLSTARSWRRCPQCRALVERSGGCNHIRCRCGRQFCYACGLPYLSSKPSSNNLHGTQGCSCPLWLG